MMYDIEITFIQKWKNDGNSCIDSNNSMIYRIKILKLFWINVDYNKIFFSIYVKDMDSFIQNKMIHDDFTRIISSIF